MYAIHFNLVFLVREMALEVKLVNCFAQGIKSFRYHAGCRPGGKPKQALAHQRGVPGSMFAGPPALFTSLRAFMIRVIGRLVAARP